LMKLWHKYIPLRLVGSVMCIRDRREVESG
jgi:hypothetical protein